MPSIGPGEIIVVMIVALLVLGPKKLPDMARSVGRGVREFKSAVSMDPDEYDERKRERRSQEPDRVESGT